MRNQGLFLLLIAACQGAPSAPDLGDLRLQQDGQQLIDALGRQVLLRGVNTGGRSKFPPYMPFAFAESGDELQSDASPFEVALAAYLDRAQSWGVNLLRVPFSWEALEPQRGSYDAVYLSRYIRLLEAAGERGMRTIVDFHQDVFARTYCGDGFPLWAAPDAFEDADLDNCHSWFMGYFSGPSRLAYDRFWANEDGLMDAFEAMWVHMAQSTWGIAGVIGYEIINEPGPGTADTEVWGPNILTPMYERLTDRVRTVAPDALILFDSTGLEGVEGETAMTRPQRDGLIFAPHYYAPSIFMTQTWTPGSVDTTSGIIQWAGQGQIWDVPILLGEFGVNHRTPNAEVYLAAQYEALDETLMHATLWEYSTTTDDWNEEGMSITGPGGVERVQVEALVRSYPSAIAGELLRWHWDPVTKIGELEVDAKADGISELVVPKRLYPGAIQVEADGAQWTHDAQAERLLVRFSSAGRSSLTLRPSP